LLILRLGLGLTMLIFGCQKMLGVFGGAGFSATVEMFDSKMGIPPVFTCLAIVAEFFGSLGVIVGLFTPIAAFGLTCTMAVATFTVAKGSGLHDALTTGNPSGFVLPVIMFFAALSVMIMGPGAYSLDSRFFRGGR
jgi:putative oxidoreductase